MPNWQQYVVSGVNTEPTKTDNTRKVVIISDAILEMERQERKSKSEPLSKKEEINQNAPKNLQIDLDSQNNTAKLEQVAQKSEVESMGAELDSLPTLHELPESAILKAPSRYGYTLNIQAFNNVADAENKRQSATRVGVNATTVYQDGVYQVLVENIDTEDEALMLKQRLYEHSIASELVMP